MGVYCALLGFGNLFFLFALLRVLPWWRCENHTIASLMKQTENKRSALVLVCYGMVGWECGTLVLVARVWWSP